MLPGVLGRSDSATCRRCILHAPFLLPTVKKNGRNAQPPFPLIHLLPGSYQREAGSQAAGGYPPVMSGWGHKTGWRMVFKSGKEKEETRCKGPRDGICCMGSKVGDLVHWQRIWSVFTLTKPWDYLNHPLQLSHNCSAWRKTQTHAKQRQMRLRQPFTKERVLKREGGRKEGEEDKRGRWKGEGDSSRFCSSLRAELIAFACAPLILNSQRIVMALRSYLTACRDKSIEVTQQ